MPKRAELDPKKAADLFSPTAPESTPAAPQPARQPDPVTSRGVGLRSSEWRHVGEIARKMGMKPGSLAAFAMRYFLAAYDQGLVEIENRPRPKLPGE